MRIFNKIRKAFRKGEALPHEHGPAIKFAAAAPKPTPKTVTVKVDVVKNPGTKASCVCGGGTCKCEERKASHAKYMAEVVKKQKQATNAKTKPSKDAENKKTPVAAKKPIPKTTAKKEAIKKDLADTPVAKKTPAKKTPAKPAAKKSAPKKK